MVLKYSGHLINYSATHQLFSEGTTVGARVIWN